MPEKSRRTKPAPKAKTGKPASSARPKKTAKAPATAAERTQDTEQVAADHQALDQFCKSIQCDDISLESWEACHQHLDLTIPVWLSATDAASGCDRQINFSRTLRPTPESPPQRQAASCLVTLPPGCCSGQKIIVKDQGDTSANLTGHLIVLVYIKS